MSGEAQLWWGLLFGSVGLGYFIYGKKQAALAPLICGIALILVPYVVTSTPALVALGLALAAAPYFFRR
jgi:hypothetical protein